MCLDKNPREPTGRRVAGWQLPRTVGDGARALPLNRGTSADRRARHFLRGVAVVVGVAVAVLLLAEELSALSAGTRGSAVSITYPAPGIATLRAGREGGGAGTGGGEPLSLRSPLSVFWEAVLLSGRGSDTALGLRRVVVGARAVIGAERRGEEEEEEEEARRERARDCGCSIVV